VFVDETGLSLVPTVRRTWAQRGRTPVLRHRQRSWSKLNQIAALSVSPRRHRLNLYWHWARGRSVPGDEIVGFVRDLLHHLRGHVILVWDNLPAHRSAAVKDLERRFARLHIERLPAYAPELNPCELLFSDEKRSLANHGFDDLDELFDQADDHAISLRRDQRRLRSCIDGTPLRIRWPT
jgi:transposase